MDHPFSRFSTETSGVLDLTTSLRLITHLSPLNAALQRPRGRKINPYVVQTLLKEAQEDGFDQKALYEKKIEALKELGRRGPYPPYEDVAPTSHKD